MDTQLTLEQKIKEILETLRPAVQSHSGAIEFVRFDPQLGIVYVKLGGACVGCPSSIFTLTYGVQQALQEQLPQVKMVLPFDE